MPRRLRCEDYAVGWVCALHTELAAAQEMLDEEDEVPYTGANDTNIYTCGRVGKHNVVIACLPEGQTGTHSAAAVASQMRLTFPLTRFGLMVGIGGGVPSRDADIRLGDVVVSKPHAVHGGVVQYDFGKRTPSGFQRTGSLNSPPAILLNATTILRAKYMRGKSTLSRYLSNLPEFSRDEAGPDIFFKSEYDHEGDTTCSHCDTRYLVVREPRRQEIVVHYGTIASGNQLMRNGSERDRVSAELGNVLCFEMEAAGLMNDFPCLVIRGICDYADSHKNKRWQSYAAATAAAFAKELLSVIPPSDVTDIDTMGEAMQGPNKRKLHSGSSISDKRNRFDVTQPIVMGRTHPQDCSQMSLNEEQRRNLIRSLGFDQIDARMATIRAAHTETCTWLVRESRYLNWIDSTKLAENHGFLWIKGKPGTGKSTIMKFALAHTCRTMQNIIAISFFFNARGNDLEKSTVGTYRSLLLQLLQRIPGLQSSLDLLNLPLKSNFLDYQWKAEPLKTVLQHAILALGKTPVVCFVDALDECEEQQIREMISYLEAVTEHAVSAGVYFRVCFSSRHYPHITIRRGIHLVLEQHNGHTQDIVTYLENELKIGNSKIAQQIQTKVQKRASGIFMWVVLVVNILNREYDSGRMHGLQRRLEEIPGDLHELFRDLLLRDLHNKEELVLCIQWILFSREPLSPKQLHSAVLSGVDPEAVPHTDEITGDVLKRFVLASSKGLAEVTMSTFPTVQFIHESVREFLLKDGLGTIWPELGTNLRGQSHERLKQCCLTFISMDIFNFLCVSENLDTIPVSLSKSSHAISTEMLPFLDYALKNVLYHADMAQVSGCSQAIFLESFPVSRWVRLHNLFTSNAIHGCYGVSYIYRHREKVSLLYLLAESNTSNLIRIHPSILSCMRVEEERYGSPLFAAMATRSREAVRAFTETIFRGQHAAYSSFWIDPPTSSYGYGLFIHSNFEFRQDRGTVSHLAQCGCDSLLAWFLKTYKVDIDLPDRDGLTPLSWASQNGHEAVVRILLQTGKVNVNKQDAAGRTPLSWVLYGLLSAKWKGKEQDQKAIMMLLLETGKIDVDIKNKNGQTPLFAAVWDRRENIVKLLLEVGKANTDLRDLNGRTPLSLAIEKGEKAIVKLLLETGKADVNLRDIDGRSPLSWAAHLGNTEIVELLLNTGKADANLMDKYEQTPLFVAAARGHKVVVRSLVEKGKANIDLKDLKGRTPLDLANLNRRWEVVSLLQDHPFSFQLSREPGA